MDGQSGFETFSVISKLSISHNFSDHYETMRSSWRLQGCKEVGPYRDVARGGTGGRARRCLRVSVYGNAARAAKLFAPTSILLRSWEKA